MSCPKCGAPSAGVCPRCYIEDHPLAVNPLPFKECGCGIAFFKGRWYEDVDELYLDYAGKSIRAPQDVEVKVTDVKAARKSGSVILDVKVDGEYKDYRFKRTLKLTVKPKKSTCDTCRKLGSGYFEAVLQVRGKVKNLDLEDRQLAKVERVRGGFDYYLISLDYARAKVSELISRGHLVKDSSKLYGKHKGKPLYRHYYSIKKPAFDVGYFIEHKGKVMRVAELGKTVKLVDLSSGKLTSATLHKLEDAPVLANPSDVKKAFVTEVRPDGIQILDEGGCETHQVPLKKDIIAGQDVDYVRMNGRIYLL